MSNNSLPAHLKRALENHVAQADISDDAELQNIMHRLTKLHDSVEKIKAQIMEKRARENPLF